MCEYWSIFKKNVFGSARWLAELVALAAKPDNLSSIPRIHVVEGENQQPHCPLTSTCVS